MDLEGWYSVTPEFVAAQIAERCACPLMHLCLAREKLAHPLRRTFEQAGVVSSWMLSAEWEVTPFSLRSLARKVRLLGIPPQPETLAN